MVVPKELSTPPSTRVVEFLERVKASPRGRVAFIVDATGSRQPSWDMAAKLQADMFEQAAAFGTLDLRLIYFRGIANVGGECKASPWTCDGRAVARMMNKITCRTGLTQYTKALEHIRREHARQPVNAAVIIGDMVEEDERVLYDAARGLGVPLFVFQEGDDPHATPIFKEMARLSNNGTVSGAYARFDAGSAAQLRELLGVVGTYATGGLTALSDLRSEAAVKLLGQMKKK
jgi:hypothetical protein